LWPNVLSLDAPVIAVVWQDAFARAFAVELGPAERVGLALAVWAIYATDRMVDGIRLGAPEAAAARHRFAHRHRVSLLVAVGAAVAALGVLAFRVPPGLLAAAAGLGAGVAGYFFWNHLAGHRFGRTWAKELIVGCVFAAGCALAPWLAARQPADLLPVGVFALLGTANALFIARLEQFRDAARGERSLPQCWPVGARPARHLAVAAGLLAILLTPGWPTLALAVATAAAGLCLTSRVESRYGPDAAAVWADTVLLAPVILWGIPIPT
jgi:hypothetical protein